MNQHNTPSLMADQLGTEISPVPSLKTVRENNGLSGYRVFSLHIGKLIRGCLYPEGWLTC